MIEGSEPSVPLEVGEGSPGGRPGLPWEQDDPGRTPAGGLATVRLVLLSPADAFRAMRQIGGLADPLLFLLVFGTLGTFFLLVWQTLARTFMGSIGGASFGAILVGNSFAVFALLFTPLLLLVFATVKAAVAHGLLVLFGGTEQPFETSLRVVSYTGGAASVLLVLPLCGSVFAVLVEVVLTIVGLANAHEVPGSRAAAAVLVPFLASCLCCAVLWIMLMGAAISLPGLVNG